MAGRLIVRNLQKSVKLDVELLRRDAVLIRKLAHAEPYDVGIVYVGKRKIKSLNRDFRQEDNLTDILSFPYHGKIIAGDRPTYKCISDYNLGDMFLCIPYIYPHCKEIRVDLRSHLARLVTHGFAHLLGYEHENSESQERMKQFEDGVLIKFSKVTGVRVKTRPTM